MALSAAPARAQFAHCEVDLSSGELIRDGRRIRLQSQPFLVLQILLERAGEVVTREELQAQLWPDKSYGDFDHGLNKAVAKLRDALDDSGAQSKLIETLPRRGYRLIAEVIWIQPRETTPIQPPSSQIRWSLVFIVSMATVIIAALLLYKAGKNSRFRPMQKIQSVAILPLENPSTDPEQEYFADGITDELITSLSRARSLRIISRASIMPFKRSTLTVPELAEKLNVDAVIEGSVARFDRSVRITIRLIGANPERQIWSSTYEGDLSNVPNLQNRIATDTVNQIRARITPEERVRLNSSNPINPEAHDEYLRARFFLNQETAQGDKAIPHLERAIQIAPDYAAAYAALGEAWAMEGIWGGKSNHEVAAKALEFSQKAVDLDPNSAESFASLGHSLMQSHRWNDGEVALRHALELDPNYLNAAAYLALLLAQKGRMEESVQISRAIAINNPVAVDFQRAYAKVLYRARQYDDAIAECLRIIELEPEHLATYSTFANALAEKGRFQEAREAFKKGGFLDPGVEAWLNAKSGDLAAARKTLQRFPKLVSVHSAVARYMIGDQETGLAELDYLANEKWAIKTYNLRNDPTFDPMRDDPRFGAILKRSGLLDN